MATLACGMDEGFEVSDEREYAELWIEPQPQPYSEPKPKPKPRPKPKPKPNPNQVRRAMDGDAPLRPLARRAGDAAPHAVRRNPSPNPN